MEENHKAKAAVILDIDGVVNSYSNTRFYVSLAYQSLRELAKIKGRRQLLLKLPKMKKMGGSNALFKFAREFCGDDATFQKYCHNLALKLNYNLIKHDPSLKEFMRRLSSFSDIVVRSDGLSEIARAAWLRVIDNRPSAKIKEEMIKNRLSTQEVVFADKPIRISGIVENKFRTKSEGKRSWEDFCIDYQIDLSKSVLIDDSRNNCRVAKELGMTAVHISRLDSLLEGSVFQCNLSNVLGMRLSHTLRKMNISYGQKVDVKKLFEKLLSTPVSAIKQSVFKIGKVFSNQAKKTNARS